MASGGGERVLNKFCKRCFFSELLEGDRNRVKVRCHTENSSYGRVYGIMWGLRQTYDAGRWESALGPGGQSRMITLASIRPSIRQFMRYMNLGIAPPPSPPPTSLPIHSRTNCLYIEKKKKNFSERLLQTSCSAYPPRSGNEKSKRKAPTLPTPEKRKKNAQPHLSRIRAMAAGIRLPRCHQIRPRAVLLVGDIPYRP